MAPLRPKHQRLVLACYPRLPKNSVAEDVRPNGSELSYLLYYVNAHKEKAQKLGEFLQRKTAADVAHAQSAHIMVTLAIITSILETLSLNGGLFAPYALNIIHNIVSETGDVSLIEAAVEPLGVICRYQNPTLILGDLDYRYQFERVVAYYALFSKAMGNKTIKSPASHDDSTRLRLTGLRALKAIYMAEKFHHEGTKQFEYAVAACFTNLAGEDNVDVDRLVNQYWQLVFKEEQEKAAMTKIARHNSTLSQAFTRPSQDIASRDFAAEELASRQAKGTPTDADTVAEEAIAMQALTCLRSIFATPNRGQIRSATISVLNFLATPHDQPKTASALPTAQDNAKTAWAAKILEICTTWIPVQDRFVLVLTVVESFTRLPLKRSELNLHLLYINLIDHIFQSDLNLIGLSVMDILLALTQQVIRILHLCESHDAEGPVSSSNEDLTKQRRNTASSKSSEPPAAYIAQIGLIERLRDCISHLAKHVYYTDQVTDMMAAILARLKPNPALTPLQSSVATAAAIENPKTAVSEAAASRVTLSESHQTNIINTLFNFDIARKFALEIVRDLLVVANSPQSHPSGGVAESRNKVPISIWEGTQWLLRDPSPKVRATYVDALCTWLAKETRPADFQPKKDALISPKKADGMVRRAVSNASAKKPAQSKKATSHFLRLLNLAIYENALEFAETSGRDIMLLHLLLTTLVTRLGVNAAAASFPMILALQDDAFDTNSDLTKVRLGSLVHGYFHTLTEAFDFVRHSTGHQILAEITRRQQNAQWFDAITFPPARLEAISTWTEPENITATEVRLQKFEERQSTISAINDFYFHTPPSSPLGSPPRSPTRHHTRSARSIHDLQYVDHRADKPMPLPTRLRDAMNEKWSRDGCLAIIAADAPPQPKATSLNDASQASPAKAPLATNLRTQLAPDATAHSRSSIAPSAPASNSSGGPRETVRVDELKRVVEGVH